MIMPFGLANAPASFQAMINGVFGDLVDKCIIPYLDVGLVFSNTMEEHLEHLRLVME